MKKEKEFYTAKEVAKIFDVSINTVYYWVKNNIIPSKSIMKGGKIYIEKEYIENWKKSS